MNSNITIIIATACLLVSTAAPATEYTIHWQVVAPAGGNATGGVYGLSDTLGEPAAHRTTVAANATVDGGFWALWSPVSFGVPVLSIERLDADTVRLSWSPAGGGWLLQRSTDLEAWNDLTADSPADESFASGGAFYRLVLP
jgi:hypothetical protein